MVCPGVQQAQVRGNTFDRNDAQEKPHARLSAIKDGLNEFDDFRESMHLASEKLPNIQLFATLPPLMSRV